MPVVYERREYLSFLLQNRDREMVKVLTGLRGAGKTALFAAYIHLLEESGVPESRILYMDLSDPDMRRYFPQDHLYRRILDRLRGAERAYIFLDEAQALPDCPRLADALFRISRFDLYLAGSGLASMLPAFSAALPGRCLVKTVYPLSFAEMAAAESRAPDEAALLRYVSESTLPGVTRRHAPRSELDGCVSAALLHEVLDNAVHPGLLEKLLRLVSLRLSDCLTDRELCAAAGRAGRPLLAKTLRAAFGRLEAAGLLLSAPLLHLAPDGTLRAADGARRYFFPDGAMTSLWGADNDRDARLLANAAAMELIRRCGAVHTVQTARGPVDFLTGQDALPALWQLIPRADETAEEKLAALAAAPDAYKKCVLTFETALPAPDGVFVYPLVPWFLRRDPRLV